VFLVAFSDIISFSHLISRPQVHFFKNSKLATMGRKNNAKQQQEQTKSMPEKKTAPAPEPKKQQKQQPQPAAKEAPAATKGGKKGDKK
jgi:hypothetical protein